MKAALVIIIFYAVISVEPTTDLSLSLKAFKAHLHRRFHQGVIATRCDFILKSLIEIARGIHTKLEISPVNCKQKLHFEKQKCRIENF